MNNGITLLLSVISSFSVGSILTTIVSHSLNIRITITDIDKKRFDFYKTIYFSAVKNSVGENISNDKAIIYFEKLYQEVKLYENKSLLLSTEVIKLLKQFHDDTKHKRYFRLQKIISREFEEMKRKFHYTSYSRIKVLKWRICLFFSVFCLTSVLVAIFFYFELQKLLKHDVFRQISSYILIIGGLAFFSGILCLIYVIENRHILTINQ